VSSLDQRLDELQNDLLATPMKIGAYADLPFALLQYEPNQEWAMRRGVGLLVNRLNAAGKNVHFISVAELLWQSAERIEGVESLFRLEKKRGFDMAQEQFLTYLSDEELESTLPQLLAERLSLLDPVHDIAFLVRTAAMAPAIYHASTLLDSMKGRSAVPTILFYPGTTDGSDLLFMELKNRHTSRNYRVKLYS